MVGMHDTYVHKWQQGETSRIWADYNIGISALLRYSKSKYTQRTLSLLNISTR